MSEINSIANGTFTIGQASATNFQAGPGIKIDEPSAGTVRIGTDETVLWSGNAESATLSEPITNFQRFKIKAANDQYFEFIGVDEKHTIQIGNGNVVYLYFKIVNFKTNGTSLTTNQNLILNYGQWNAASPNGFYYDRTADPNWIKEVIGIGRISGSNT